MIDLSAVDTDLLRQQRNYLLSLSERNEMIEGIINLLDFILDELDFILDELEIK